MSVDRSRYRNSSHRHVSSAPSSELYVRLFLMRLTRIPSPDGMHGAAGKAPVSRGQWGRDGASIVRDPWIH